MEETSVMLLRSGLVLNATGGLRGRLSKIWSTCAEDKGIRELGDTKRETRLLPERRTVRTSGLEKQQMSEGRE